MHLLAVFPLLTLLVASADAQSRILTPNQCAEKLNFQRCIGLTSQDMAVSRTPSESLTFIKANVCSPQCTDMWDQYATLGSAYIEQQCGGQGATAPLQWQKPHVQRATHKILCTQDGQGNLCAATFAQFAAKLNLTRPVNQTTGKLQPYPLSTLPKDLVCSECTAKLFVVAREMDEQLKGKGETDGVGIPVPFDDKAVVERRAICREEEKKPEGEKKVEIGTGSGTAGAPRGVEVVAIPIVMSLLAMLL